MVRNIIWDWNGTILDDTQICYEIANLMLRKRGLREIPSFDEYRGLFRFPVIDYYYETGYTFEDETYEEVADEFLELYRQKLPGCSLKDGIRETIAELDRMGMTQILLSTTGQQTLEGQLVMFRMDGLFRDVLGQQDDLAYGKAKKAEQYFLQEGFDRKETVFIGDTDHDFEVASSLGCGCILIDTGNQTREVLLKCGVPVVHSLREIPGLIRRMNGESETGTDGPRPGKYRHFKGNCYELLYTAKHSETMEDMVVYRALYGEHGIWVRPLRMWDETVEFEGKKVRRFTYLEE